MDADLIDDDIEGRYRFRLPELYRRMRNDGCFHPLHEAHLQFADLLWLSAEQIRDWRFDDRQVPNLVPLAQTARGDLWCFYPTLDHEGGTPVVFCPEEDEVAVVLAPHFEAFVYRALLEEFACTGLTERLDLRQSRDVLAGYVARMDRYLRPEWRSRLNELATRAWRGDRNDYYGVLDSDELESLLHEDLAYPRLDEEFEHFLPN